MSLIIPTQTCYGGKNQTSDDVPGIAPGAWEAVHCYKNLALVITITQYWLHSQYFWNVIRCLVAWLSSGLSSSEIPTSSSPLLPAVWAASHTEATRKGNSKALTEHLLWPGCHTRCLPLSTAEGPPFCELALGTPMFQKREQLQGRKCLSCVAQLPRTRAGCKHGVSDSQPMLSPPHRRAHPLEM